MLLDSTFASGLETQLEEPTGFKKWIFTESLLFGSRTSWPHGSLRNHPHTGLDFATYQTKRGAWRQLSSGLLVPAAKEGTVAGIYDEGPGKTIVLRHTHSSEKGMLYTVYGHVVPGVSVGERLDAGQHLGTLVSLPAQFPYLHLGVAWLPFGFSEELNSETLRNSAQFSDPLAEMTLTYRIA